MAVTNNSAFGPPPLQTPITQETTDQFGVPYQSRQGSAAPAAPPHYSWGQWFNSVFSQVQSLVASVATLGTTVATLVSDFASIVTGFPGSYSSFSVTGKTAAIATSNLRHGGVVLPAGDYLVAFYLLCSVIGTNNVQVTIGWDDGAAAQTDPSGIQGLITLGRALVWNEFYHLDGVHDLTYAVAYSGGTGGTYALYINVLRLS
jgi:hypothetical protein